MPLLRNPLSPKAGTMQVTDAEGELESSLSRLSSPVARGYNAVYEGDLRSRRLTQSSSFITSDSSSAESQDDVPEERLQQYRRVMLDVTSVTRRSFVLPRDSLYGSAMVLPQVTRSLDCHSFYVGKCIVHWIGLYFIMFMQIALVVQVHSLLQWQDTECDQNRCDCLRKGFIPLQVDQLDGVTWRNLTNLNIGQTFSISGKKWFLCRAAGGDDYHILRKLCVMAFVIALFKDLRQSAEMARFLYSVPTEAGHWMVVVNSLEDSLHVRANGHKQIVRRKSPGMMWQVAPLEWHWKLTYFICLLIPKTIIFFCVYWMGSVWLMSEVERSELILNAVALVFVLDLDELLFAAIATSDVQQYMDNLQPWTPMTGTPLPGGDLQEDEENRFFTEKDDEKADEEFQELSAVDQISASFAEVTRSTTASSVESSAKALVVCSMNVMVFPIVLVVAMVMISVAYESHCYSFSDHAILSAERVNALCPVV